MWEGTRGGRASSANCLNCTYSTRYRNRADPYVVQGASPTTQRARLHCSPEADERPCMDTSARHQGAQLFCHSRAGLAQQQLARATARRDAHGHRPGGGIGRWPAAVFGDPNSEDEHEREESVTLTCIQFAQHTRHAFPVLCCGGCTRGRRDCMAPTAAGAYESGIHAVPCHDEQRGCHRAIESSCHLASLFSVSRRTGHLGSGRPHRSH